MTPSPEAWVEKRYNALIDLYVVTTALELGLGELLVERVALAELLEKTGAEVRGLTALLQSLSRLGLAREDRGWQLTDDGRSLMGAGTRGRGQLAQLGYNGPAWPHLAGAMREGADNSRLVWPEWAHDADLSDPWPERTASESTHLAELLSPLPAGATFADLGCGDGRVTEALLAANPDARAIVVDRRLVLDRTLARLGALASRIEPIEADLLTMRFDARCDLIMLNNVLHSYNDADGQRIVANAAALLKPTGRLVVRDLLRDPSPDGERAGLDFALHMAMLSPVGDAHPPERIAGWLRAAGLPVTGLDGYDRTTGCHAMVGTKGD